MNKWLIYSKNNCPYCDKAKFALKDEDVEVRNINDKPGYLQELLEKKFLSPSITNEIQQVLDKHFGGSETHMLIKKR